MIAENFRQHCRRAAGEMRVARLKPVIDSERELTEHRVYPSKVRLDPATIGRVEPRVIDVEQSPFRLDDLAMS